MIVSFHPRIKGDKRLPMTREALMGLLGGPDAGRFRGAVVSQAVRGWQYWLLRQAGLRLFPNYDYRFGLEGKWGNARFFERFGLNHPKTWLFAGIEGLRSSKGLKFPLVVKAHWGGGGQGVFLARSPGELDAALEGVAGYMRGAQGPVVAQEFLDSAGRDMRVVAIGDRAYAYWRRQEREGEFRNNLAMGARIDREGEPRLLKRGIAAVRDAVARTGVNLAGFDLIFPRGSDEPMFLEINYCFGRKGLGGSVPFFRVLEHAVSRWAGGLRA